MRMRPRDVAACCVSMLLLVATTSEAQARFQVLEQQIVAEVSGLRIVTVRDQQRSECYTLFIMEPPAVVNGDLAPPAAEEDPSVQRIRAATEWRDQQLAELRAQVDRSGWWDAFAVGRYEMTRQQVENAYQLMLREEIPGSYSWSSYFPGMPNGGWEDAANAMRRAIVDPRPESTATLNSQLARLDSTIGQLLNAPQVAASGPVGCATDTVDRKKAPSR